MSLGDTGCFFKQKTAYELRISDWSSDVCSSDLPLAFAEAGAHLGGDFVVEADLHWAQLDRALGADHLHAVTAAADERRGRDGEQIGRASCRERVRQYV